ncbi:hypothetical protein [Pelagovum pacificum]|uniref:TIGR03016 family PEP-CTERM system-associated outer membrane protein n=1 Tax=Pelagovum pacificum TaxID=2588711 RepID=A0A5C5GE32_9RHOB|nr:hypothetical protein [Pelagovum pacificum]QQA43906.1 hypothetical protein I8N54_04820 [Pelagovum pacificum]TNY32963.1 hypothetical protein FHY64_06720 [Pelagovum pacificum]
MKILVSGPIVAVSCTVTLLTALPAAAQTQDTQAAPEPPAVAPLTTSFVLNGTPLNFGTDYVADYGASFGDSRNAVPLMSLTVTLEDSLEESISGGLFRRHQTGRYLMLRTVPEERRITTVLDEEIDLTGTTTRLTLTGRCFLPGSDPDAYCSYTPGLSSSQVDIDPDTLLPRNFNADSDFGTEIDRATHEALKADGFQRGAPGSDEVVGLSIELPNSGFVYSTARADRNGIERTEDVDSWPMLSFAEIDQNLYSNSTSAALDRTIRGAVLLPADDWDSTAVLMQTLAWMLPGYDAELAPDQADPRLNISNNLFYAANNIRLPENGYTVFHTATAWGDHALTPPTRASETPVAWGQGVWVGYSPVTKISRTSRSRIVTTSDPVVEQQSFRQAGVTYDVDQDIAGTISILDIATQELAQFDITNIQDIFVQSGSIVTSQEAIRRITTLEEYDYSYVPHLSFSGNRTDGTSVLRYYTGVLVGDSPNAYVGGDYTLNTESGLQASLGATFYSEPTYDHYSYVNAALSKRYDLQRGQLSLGIAGSAELERPELDGTVDPAVEGDNIVDLTSVYTEGAGTYSLRQRFANVGNDEDERTESTTLGYAFRVNPNLSVNYEVTPWSTEDSYFSSRAGLDYRFAEMSGQPVLSVQYARIDYDYGTDNVGGDLTDTEETLFATLKLTF